MMRRRGVSRRTEVDHGYTLVEMAVAVALTGTLLAISLIVFNTFAHVETGTFSSYAELNQLTPVGTAFQRLLRTAVSPATGGVGAAPVPPFGIYTATGALTSATPISKTSLTFFANTGNANGPAMVTATLTVTTVAARPTAGTFLVTEKWPTSTSCPGLGSATTPTQPATNRCDWSTQPQHTVLRVSNVLVASTKPVFAYHLTPPLNNPPTLPPATKPGYGTPADLGLSPFGTCTATSCPADHIQSVTVDIEVHVPGAKNKVESQTVTYQLSTVSQTYSKAVG